MDMLQVIKEMGVVGAGGAGFPTHIKLDCNAEYVIANGAECEPLLCVDQQVMACKADQLVVGIEIAMAQTGAENGIIYLKKHYHHAVAALVKALRHRRKIRLFLAESYYPAGDEQQIIYDVTRRVVPPGGLPKDVGCVVSNVSTLVNVAAAVGAAQPVTEKMVTVGGAVRIPSTLNIPIGTPLSALVQAAGGATEDCVFIEGGPCMGIVRENLSLPVTKTTGGLLAIPKDHPLLKKKSDEINYKVMQSVCCQCSMCTQMCPRHALGLNTSPHKAMRALASGADLIGDVTGILTCCDCGVCTYFACNFGLNPAGIMKRMKQEFLSKGLRIIPGKQHAPDPFIGDKRLPTQRLVARLGLDAYDVPAPLEKKVMAVKQVCIPAKMHVGVPGMAVVAKGDVVTKGQLVFDVPDTAIGARIHASISGIVTDLNKQMIRIEG